MSLAQIAEVMGVGESRVCQLHDGNAGAKAVPIAKQVLDAYYYQ